MEAAEKRTRPHKRAQDCSHEEDEDGTKLHCDTDDDDDGDDGDYDNDYDDNDDGKL